MNTIDDLLEQVNQRIEQYQWGNTPPALYDPIRYIMALGGKRLRPLLVLLSYKLFRSDIQRAIDPSLAVEFFHNFTLVHDDIMDDAPLRRGQETIHKKWNHNQAILSGDVIQILSYQFLLACDKDVLPDVLRHYNKTAIEVCEGQQMDIEFENMEQVSEAQYIEMIRLKTAVLLGFSLELGGFIAGQPAEITRKLYDFGSNVGIGFQIKDDLLDVYADKEKFGKQTGGDIIANKKTFLLIKALEHGNAAQQRALYTWLRKETFDPVEKVSAVKAIYDEIGIRELTINRMNDYFKRAFDGLSQIQAQPEARQDLVDFTNYLINREK